MDFTDRHHARHRRDGLGDLIDDLFPRQRGGRDDEEDEEDEKPTSKKGPKTIVRTRYRTLEPTFTGEIGGFSTRRPKDDDEETTTTKARPKSTSTVESTTTAAPQPTSTPGAAETQLPAATQSAAPASEGMSGGAKAGIAIGAVAGVLAIVGLIFLLLARKRRQKEGMQGLDNEKMNGAFAPGSYAPTPAQAAAASAAAGHAPGAYGAPGNHAYAAPASLRNEPRSPTSPWERPMTSSSQNAANPFGSHAELAGSRPSTPPSGHTAAAAAVAGGIGAMAGAAATRGLQRQTSRNQGRKLDLTLPPPGTPMSPVPPSPARTEYSVSSVPSGQHAPATAGSNAIAAAGGPPGSAVHRVQLDFEPTLEDELGLKAGQLVRVLHEYDDGWALCIKLDRSRQGVVPRTCLSTRPVKPRTGSQGRAGPPVNPNRPITPKTSPPPQNPASRPTTPGGPPQSPGPRYQPMPPRHTGSASPGPARVMSPAPGPLSAPMPAPVSSAASVVSSLSASDRQPSPASVEPSPVLKEGPAMKAEFTPLPAPAATEPIGELDLAKSEPAIAPAPKSPTGIVPAAAASTPAPSIAPAAATPAPAPLSPTAPQSAPAPAPAPQSPTGSIPAAAAPVPSLPTAPAASSPTQSSNETPKRKPVPGQA